MTQADLYLDLKSRTFVLAQLDQEERDLIRVLQKFSKDHPDWIEYENFWMPRVAELYSKRGLSRREIIGTDVWRIAQDIGSRLAIATGIARPTDYRDELEELIRNRFKTRREFCEATGLSEDMLSHVLSKRKNLAIGTLAEALARIGYTIHIAPVAGGN